MDSALRQILSQLSKATALLMEYHEKHNNLLRAGRKRNMSDNTCVEDMYEASTAC